MLPSIINRQIDSELRQFLRHAFRMGSPLFRRADGSTAMDEFLATEGLLAKGPYVSLQLPFRISALPLDYFANFQLPFAPYQHQAIAYERLSRPQPLSTLVATGTGSGKTECFLYPILNYCANHKAPGIKAIIIYPMNALATDQAKRFAKEVFNNPGLKNRVTVGLYVGQEDADKTQSMQPEKVITDKETLRQYPPDILLTNYKMLDYLLLRPQDQPLWQHNTPETLQYIVVDELHTFDGAQGTDLACLLRRLKHRLQSPTDHIAVVGTSATVGNSSAALIDYASDIFDARFDAEAVINEDRYSAAEYLSQESLHFFSYPAPDALPDWHDDHSLQHYINQSIACWFEEDLAIDADWESDAGRAGRIKLGEKLKQHRFFHHLLHKLAGQAVALEALAQDMIHGQHYALSQRLKVVENFCALISVARLAVNESEAVLQQRIQQGKPRPVLPLLQVRFQHWVRELRRMVATLGQQRVEGFVAEPQLLFSDDLATDTDQIKYLPVIHCRDCHATGWGGVLQSDSDTHIEDDLPLFYQLYFEHRPEAVLLFPIAEEIIGQALTKLGQVYRLCPQCLRLNTTQQNSCVSCHHEPLLSLFLYNDSNLRSSGGATSLVANHNCPFCRSEHGLSIIGARVASLLSVMAQNLFGSRFNSDKQLITFNDSVQDAAHRAGFITARAYPLLIRSFFAKVIQHAPNEISLSQLAIRVGEEALSGAGSEENFVGTFIAPDMQWQWHYKELTHRQKLPEKSPLVKRVKQRLAWELLVEMGLRSVIGRSLLRSGSAAVTPSLPLLDKACLDIHAALTEEIGRLNSLSVERVELFVVGIVQLLLSRGAIYHPLLKTFIQQGGNSYRLSRVGDNGYFMPNYGPRSRLPRFLSVAKLSAQFDSVQGKQSLNAPYLNWFKKSIAVDSSVLASGSADLVYRRALAILHKQGLLATEAYRGEPVYGLNPDHLQINRQPISLRCDHCHIEQIVAADLRAYWQKAPCLVNSCSGELIPSDEAVPSGRWEQLQSVRINGFEHTGLLDRPLREQIEQSFIKGKQVWDLNLLSATPTLEMGIDIGDLSTVALSSVPPAQSNYLQRIGRAGRRDGNAYNITFTEAQPHDLYYFEDPLQMIQGDVEPPGVFLGAIAVLERQLTAFCFDRWIATGVDESMIPKSVRELLNSVEGGQTHHFPFLWFDFIERHQGALLEAFVQLFENLDREAIAHLSRFIRGGGGEEYSLSWRIRNRLQQLIKERASLNARVKKIDNQVAKLAKAVIQESDHEEKVEALQGERTALRALIRSMNSKQTLNFFTDEGLLPNYTFPEEGVTIRSILWRKREADESSTDGTQFIRTTYEYERPSASAIAELAPDNYFYAGGHKVEIEQVDLKLSEIENWKICDNCHYAENIDITKDLLTTCPKCQSVTWGDSGQKTQMVKLRQVYARTPEQDARISDDSDNREPKFYKRQMLVSYEPADLLQAYKIDCDDLPFGFDFLKKVNIKDINFGVPDSQCQESAFAGDKAKRSGFYICNQCGMVKTRKRNKIKHDLTCPYHDDLEKAEDPANFIHCLYLYRELASEAIRMVLPVSSYRADSANEASFAAAIQLGIKHYFKGSIDHIRATTYSEPLNEGGRIYYLVIYDSIPGGTGYLKELMRDPQNLFALIEKAFVVLDSCGCNQDPLRDGCYHCLYAYRDRYNRLKISRDLAKKLMLSILENRQYLVEVASLAEVNPNVLLESELEQKFIDTLKLYSAEWRVSNSTVNGKNGYLLTVGTKDKLSVAWKIEPQVNLDSQQGVDIASKPDFILWPVKTDATIKPIALFLDGYEFHRDIVADDANKRLAIAQSGKFMVWTLYWDDLESDNGDHLKAYLNQYQNKMVRDLLGSTIGDKHYAQWQTVHNNKNSFSLLIDILKEPPAALSRLTGCAVAHTLCWLSADGRSDMNTDIAHKLAWEMRENAPPNRVDELLPDEPFWFGGLLDSLQSSEKLVEIATSITLSAFGQAHFSQSDADLAYLSHHLKTHICFDDRDNQHPGYKAALIGYWKLINILQLLDNISWCSRTSVKNGASSFALETSREARIDAAKQPEPSSEKSAAWQSCLDETLLSGEIERFYASKLPIPEVGYELTLNSVVVAEAELAWEAKKVAVFAPTTAESEIEHFKQQGWSCLSDPVHSGLIEQLEQLLGVN
ncbi:DEAD/DEAH box helicase [Ectothiorhodospiraceae bacterium BW-2]|nr:DEAD/DEAH box helicase [Ectothiorhodospiraceae bacterium BW-2]